jgi:nucleoside-diphosphate-sugar epimerase
MSLRILFTGASGFVGQALCTQVVTRGFSARAALRTNAEVPSSVESVVVGEINSTTVWDSALRGVDAVIHLAARVHVMHDDAANPLDEFRKVNVAGTEQLARSAAASGVKRLVYVSSIKVNGESTLSPNPTPMNGGGAQNKFTESDTPCPQDPYGISKCEAEQALHRIAEETGLEIVIVRPPLVYGPGVKGNFVQMLKVLAKGIPLPLASVRNLRSLVYVENLADALIVCATHPDAVGQTYLVSDGEDISTPDLLRQLGSEMGRPARLFPCPLDLLKWAGRLSGKADQIERLLGSLRVDSNKIRRELDWAPPYTLQQGLQKTATWYVDSRPH